MRRLDGFLFHYPGIPSLVVVYHDSYDFFYSGHIGTCFIITMEYRACKWFNQWFMMTCVRTHYVIDMIAGVIVAHYMHMIAEKICYYFDVAVLKIGSTN